MRKVGNNPGRFCDIAAIDRDVKGRRPFWVVNRGGVGRGGRTDGKGSKMAHPGAKNVVKVGKRKKNERGEGGQLCVENVQPMKSNRVK